MDVTQLAQILPLLTISELDGVFIIVVITLILIILGWFLPWPRR